MTVPSTRTASAAPSIPASPSADRSRAPPALTVTAPPAPSHLFSGTVDTSQYVGQSIQVSVGLDGDGRSGAERPLQLIGRVEGEDLAVVHDRHPVAELVGFLHVVGGEEDGLSAAVQFAQDLPQG